MKRTILRLLPLIMAFSLLLAACNLPSTATPVANDPEAIHTAAAQTVMAQLTQVAVGTPIAVQPTNIQPGSTDVVVPPTNTLPPAPPTDTLVPPTATLPPPTATQVPPTGTRIPATATPLPCNRAQFVRDVNVPDNTEFNPGESFTKTWRLKNNGSCTWTDDYRLVFFNGDEMGADTVRLDENVRPGETIDLSVDLTAPGSPGTYRSNWMLRDDDGRFGIGEEGSKPFWVQIEVVEPDEGVIYNFANSYCSAEWETDEDELPCPGKGTEDSGFVVRLTNPKLEHRTENEPTLWTNPPEADNSWIAGTYPAIKIRDDDHFVADVGCMADSEDCDVTFQLNYRIGDGSVKTLGEWDEIFDGKVTRVDVDLSDLDGENVRFILTVLTNGEYDDDAAFWLVPHIIRD